ncbi:MAG: lipase maturation factor family protein, partial [Thermoanaerobaculia bacterium]
LLLDDGAWPARLRARLAARTSAPGGATAVGSGRGHLAERLWRTVVVAPLGTALLVLSLLQMSATLGLARALPAAALEPLRWARPLRSVNGYGLFAVMTTSRPEIIVEGSRDGRTWVPYRFGWKPGPLEGRPRFVEPHQPRLDWQMWFAALAGPRRTPWFEPFLDRLLEGSPAVAGLLGEDPFPDGPPRFVRAELYDYRFTDLATRRASGRWWERSYVAPYSLSRSPRRGLRGPPQGDSS